VLGCQHESSKPHAPRAETTDRMSSSSIYDKVDRILQESSLPNIRRREIRVGTEWAEGQYSVELKLSGRPPYQLKLDRKGGRRKPLFFDDEPGTADAIAQVIVEHFRDQRNAD
jgi:hypothetical protein